MAQGDDMAGDPAWERENDERDEAQAEETQEPREDLPPTEGEELVHHKEVVAVIRAVLRETGCPDQAVDDLAGDVQLAVIVSARRLAKKGEVLGEDLKRWKGLARNTARNMGLNWREADRVRREGMIKLAPDAQSVAPPRSASGMDPIDMKRAIEVYKRMPRHPQADEMVDATRTGEGPSDAAREAGLKPKRGHKILETTRERYTAALKVAKLGTLLGVVGLSFLFSRGTSVHPWEMQGKWSNIHIDQPRPPKQLGPSDDPESLRQRAAELRAKAAAECDELRMTECYEDMHRADAIDRELTNGPPLPRETSAKPGN